MFRKNIEAIIADGLKQLEGSADRLAGAAKSARDVVATCSGEIQALVDLARDIPEKVFDRYSSVMVSTIQVHPSPGTYHYVAIGNAGQSQLRGLMGDETIKAGKYRVVVLLEPIS